MRCDLEMSVSFSLDSLKMCVHFQNVRSFSIWHICNCTTHLTLNSNKPILESLPKKHFDSQIWNWDRIRVLTVQVGLFATFQVQVVSYHLLSLAAALLQVKNFEKSPYAGYFFPCLKSLRFHAWKRKRLPKKLGI